MLQRTLSRQGAQGARRRLKPVLTTLGIVMGAAVLYALLPEPRPRLRPVPLTDNELAAALASLSATPPAPGDRAEKERSALGRKLFSDKGLSADGTVACATCHVPERGFVDGLPHSAGIAGGLALAPKNSSSVVNSYMNHWFFWDGRADSLAAQALGPVEDAAEHGVSRVFVARRLMTDYAADYERAFGAFPEALRGAALPDQALPPPARPELTIDVAAYALATLGSFDALSGVLDSAQKTRLAPAMELSRRAFTARGPKEPVDRTAWHEAWAAMPEAQRVAVNQVFANFGRALAAFQSGLVAVDSPFDRFTARVAKGAAPEAALDQDFGARELAGLKLFAGPGRCTLCHAGPNLTDQQFHNIGLEQRGEAIDAGRAAGVLLTAADPFNCAGTLLPQRPEAASESCRELPYLDAANPELVGAFKTPSLRNVALTAPYMHDGRFATLREVLEHYSELSVKPAVGHREESLQPLELTEEETEALEAFLTALSSPVRDVNLDERVGVR